jgi:hypothetical protein
MEFIANFLGQGGDPSRLEEELAAVIDGSPRGVAKGVEASRVADPR